MPTDQQAGESTERRVHPFFRDVGITLAAQAAAAVGSLLLYRLLATETGTDGFASYSLVKQAVGFLFPIITVGLVGGLPRYIALPANERGASIESYLLAALAICAVTAAVAALLALAAPSATAGLFFGNANRDSLVAPFVALAAATNLFYVAYGYFRGLLRVGVAGTLQVLGLAALPASVVWSFSGLSVSALIAIIAGGTALISAASIALPLSRALRNRHRRNAATAGRTLLNYGHRRVPGELAQLALGVLVPVLAAHVATLTDVAYLSAAQQVLSIVAFAFLPLGLVLLPSLTRAISEDRERASRNVADLAAFALHAALFLSVQVILFADTAVELWLGDAFADAGSVVRVAASPAALYVVYLVLRSTLDAAEVRSYNSRNNLIALAVFAGCAAATLLLDIGRPVMAVAWSFTAGVVTQGALTFVTVHRLFAVRWSDYALPVALPAGAATAAAGFALSPLVEPSVGGFAILVAGEALIAAAYATALVRARVGWSRLFAERFFQRGR